jgi:branched-chain amino acid aminotransferase
VQVFLNGRFIPEAQAVVPITDRGFLYGDGLFETLRVRNGQPVWWDRHLERLEQGAQHLKIPLPWLGSALCGFAHQLIDRNAMPESVLRVTLSRGSGSRGFSSKDANSPTVAMTLHSVPPTPKTLRLTTSSIRIPVNDPMMQFKTSNKLASIMARAEAEEQGADEALLLNTDNYIAEAAASNIFWLSNGAVCTPPVSDGALAGVARSVVLELCQARDVTTREARIIPKQLLEIDGVFLTNSVAGILPVSELDGMPLRQSLFISELRECLEAEISRDIGDSARH